MIKAKDFKILSIQFSIFTPNLVFSLNKIHVALGGKFSDLFDGNPYMFPLPSDAPREIPRLTLFSADQKYKLEVSLDRVNFLRLLRDSDVEIDENAVFNQALEIFKTYVEATSAKVGRLAVVTNRFIEQATPGLALAQHFCKEQLVGDALKRPENFEIHAHKRYDFDALKVNSWVRSKTGVLTNGKIIVLVEQDINTLAEEVEKHEFNSQQMHDFFGGIIAEQKNILMKYFPNE